MWPAFYNNFKWSITFKNYESLYYIHVIYITLYSNYTSIFFKWTEDQNRCFSEDIHMTNRYEKALNFTKYQRNAIKTTMRYHLKLIRMVIVRKIKYNKNWKAYGKMETPAPLAGMWIDTSIKQNNIEVSQRINRTTIWSRKPSTGTFPNKWNQYLGKVSALFMFIIALSPVKMWKQPKCSLTDEWIQKCSLHFHTREYYIIILYYE